MLKFGLFDRSNPVHVEVTPSIVLVAAVLDGADIVFPSCSMLVPVITYW